MTYVFIRLFKNLIGRPTLRLFIALLFFSPSLYSADYQWSVPIKNNDAQARAFLWIPPACKYVRGVVIANQVILEKQFCDNNDIREACTKENLAIVILFRAGITFFDYKAKGDDKKLQNILDDLASESGYSEISTAPLFPVGHSGGAIGAWNIAYSNPDRVFGILTLHAAAATNPPEADPKARIDGIPAMAVSGEYESWTGPEIPLDKHWRWLRGNLLDMRAKYEEALVCEVVQPGAGHFNFDGHLAKLTAMFLQKAAFYRIPKRDVNDTIPVRLNHVKEDSGWLTDISLMAPSKFPPTQARLFKGDRTLAFWSLDEEMAKAVESFSHYYGGPKDQRVTFVEDGKPLPATWITDLKFQPVDDGLTIKLKGDFLTSTPEGVAGAGKPLDHLEEGRIKFRLIGGWGGGGEQIGQDAFRIKFDHFGISRFTNNIQVMAYSEGNELYKYAEQAGQIKFPEKNTVGKAQVISFAPLTNLSASIRTVKLHGQSDSGYPVSYFVRSGPAEVKGDELIINPIPPRAKYPVKITVVAYQWGRSIEPLFQSAIPVEQNFYIVR